MGKTRGVHETTPELRNRMVGMYEAGLGLREIAAAVNCSQRTVKRWLNRFDKEGTVETRERCGRKRATTVEQDEAIIRLATQTPITAAKAVLPALGLTCSVDTVRERLHKAGIHNWSPSRKYMQRIPLGDADGDSNKSEKNSATPKKRNPGRKARSREAYVDDGTPPESQKQNQNQNIEQQQQQQQGFVFPQQNLPPPPPGPQATEMQPSAQPLPTSQTEFSNALSLAQQPQPIYQHPGLAIVQNWPLDLVQGSHHYPQGQPHPIAHEQPPPQQQLQELHTQQEQQHMHAQSRLQDQSHQQNTQPHHHNLDQQQQQQQLSMEHQVQQQCMQSSLPSPEQTHVNIGSDSSNSCSSNENSQSSCEPQQKTESSRESGEKSEWHKKKKGGKAKGTLETSVEIRNRMIGMSEAGLSTLSIALAIDRSERTVKRWLERWHKEGNVQTKERKGRRRITTKEQDDAIVAMATQHPLTAAKYVAPALGLKCSVDTIRERLHKAGIHSWKLGKKQGEGNAVHTVHLWQPSGNRPNKPKMAGEKRKKSGNKKRDPTMNIQKRIARKKKNDEPAPLKATPPPTNMMPEQSALPFHNPGTMANYASASNIMQPVHNIAVPPPALPQPQPPPPPAPQSMQPMGPLMQQRPDCRLAPIIPPVSGPGNPGIAYPSCMIGGNSHTGHMEQTDPLNYEPYIWSFNIDTTI
nr:PREDICTED: LOW QUALITY PROTEIN: mediator of RNA polymerase II transcription subunit 15-like [Linepithema humile]